MSKHPLHNPKSPLIRGDWKEIFFIYLILQIVPSKMRGGSEGDGVCHENFCCPYYAECLLLYFL